MTHTHVRLVLPTAGDRWTGWECPACGDHDADSDTTTMRRAAEHHAHTCPQLRLNQLLDRVNIIAGDIAGLYAQLDRIYHEARTTP